MSLYVLADLAGNLERSDPQEFAKSPPDLKHKGWQWLPVEDVMPDFDKATEMVRVSTAEVKGGKFVRTFEKVAQPAPEPTLEERVALLEARVDALDGP